MLTRLPLLILSAIGLVAIFFLLGNRRTPPFPNEGRACDAASAKNVIIKTMVTDTRDSILNGKLKESVPGSPGYDMLHQLQSWSATVTNIRQRNYDQANDTRYCVAQMEHQNLPVTFFMIAPMLGITANVCHSGIRYKIEKLANRKGEYVSWTCND